MASCTVAVFTADGVVVEDESADVVAMALAEGLLAAVTALLAVPLLLPLGA